MKTIIAAFFLFIWLCDQVTTAQELVQTIKGTVVDADSYIPLPGATVIVTGISPPLGAVTDASGRFRIENVPVGRHSIEVSYMGYESYVVPEVVVVSGKETDLRLQIREKVTRLNVVEISADSGNNDLLSRIEMLGAHQINMEQAGRYAGAADDPARLVSAFAGVASGLASNGIVVRGNPAKGLLWRLEEVEISNPNHFADLVVFGAGGLCALSNQMLATSEFYTGAFTPEYSNALSGVFDMSLRTGNSDKREYSAGISTNGLEVSSEGPFKTGMPSTYLVQYRFSTLTLLQPILPPEAGVISYQDMSWKLSFPRAKSVWSFWGFGAVDAQKHDAQQDSAQRSTSSDFLQYRSRQFTLASGISHKMHFSNQSFLSTVFSLAGNGVQMSKAEIHTDGNLYDSDDIQSEQFRLTMRSTYTHKFSARSTMRMGGSLTLPWYNTEVRSSDSLGIPLQSISEGNGQSLQCNGFVQSKIRMGSSSALTAGIHATYNDFNHQFLVEPRINVLVAISRKVHTTLASGLYSKPEPLNIYLIRNGSEYPNRDLALTRAFHAVAGVNWFATENIKLKAECYHQEIFDVPVVANSSFSMINADAIYMINNTFISKGRGKNTGIDVTIERKLKGSYYYMVTAGLFDSKYLGGDNIWRNTRFNKHYVVNILGGYEWKTGHKKNNLLNVNFRMSLMGGDRLETVDLEASNFAQDVVFDDSRAFENKKPDTQILSFALNYRVNKRRSSTIWTFQVINVLGQKDVEGYEWDEVSQSVILRADPYFIPSVSWKIEW